MKRKTFAILPAFALTLFVAGCSSGSDTPSPSPSGVVSETAFPTPVAITPSAAVTTTTTQRTLTLEGLDDLKIGQVVPVGTKWAKRGAQVSDACQTVTAPGYPGVYAMVTGGKVRRITVGQRSDVKLIEGLGVGASESDVKKWFAGFREEPHKYVETPAKYLTAPNAASGDPALRFEIGSDRKVSMMHVGTMPELGYVEGCS